MIETASILAGAFLVFFVASALVYGIARSVCAFFSPKLREVVQNQTWTQFLLVAATSAAILMLLYPWCVGSVAIEAAKRARTANEANEIQTAILGFYIEYAEMPPATDNAALIKILTGANLRANPRGIAFLSVSPRDLNAKGEMLDAWQTPLHISFADRDHLTITSDKMPPNFKIEVNRPDP